MIKPNPMDELKKLLNFSGTEKEDDINNRFQEIAKTLMGNYIIKKGEKRYAIVEIEFYLYTPSHQDFITYPRKMEEGRWFFHPSGVDLTFNTTGEPKEETNKKGKKKMSYKECSFGGILIRGIYLLDKNQDKENVKRDNYTFGPLKCVDILWDDFYAFRNSYEEYPIIIEASETEKVLLQDTPLINCKRCINVKEENRKDKEKDWIERIVIKEDSIEEVTSKSNYSQELFDSKEKYLYRFFNMLSNEDPKNFTKIQPINARPEITYRVKK